MKGFRFLGRRYGFRRYISLVVVLLVLVMIGFSIPTYFTGTHTYNQDDYVGNNDVENFVQERPDGTEFKSHNIRNNDAIPIPAPGQTSQRQPVNIPAANIPDVNQEKPVYEDKPLDEEDSNMYKSDEDDDYDYTENNEDHKQVAANPVVENHVAADNPDMETGDNIKYGEKIETDLEIHNIPKNGVKSINSETEPKQNKAIDDQSPEHPQSYYDTEEDVGPGPEVAGPEAAAVKHDVVVNNVNKDDNIRFKIPLTNSNTQYDSEEDELDKNEIPLDQKLQGEVIQSNNLDINRVEKADTKFDKNSDNSFNNQRNSLSPIVPNNVHYIWFGDSELKFHQMISILSAYHFIKPDAIFFHCNSHPSGQWWTKIQSTVPNIKVDIRSVPREVFGYPVTSVRHQADVAKLQTLMMHGGIYLDTDVIVMKSFEQLRSFEFNIGLSQPGRFDSNIVVATKTSKFLQKWLVTYTKYSSDNDDVDYFSCVAPYKLYQQYPEQVHVEQKTLSFPTADNIDLLYKHNVDVNPYYAVHLWRRLYDKDEDDLNTIQNLNTTYGNLVRLIYNKS